MEGICFNGAIDEKKYRLEKIVMTAEACTEEELFKKILPYLQRQRMYAKMLLDKNYSDDKEREKLEMYLEHAERHIKFFLALI